jgi:hypothetical protein
MLYIVTIYKWHMGVSRMDVHSLWASRSGGTWSIASKFSDLVLFVRSITEWILTLENELCGSHDREGMFCDNDGRRCERNFGDEESSFGRQSEAWTGK